jgi:probable O-glycosylation ligase (exosortase A-associated)
MRSLLLAAFVFALLPLVLARPYVGILLWSWLGYMNPHRLTFGFAYDFPFAYTVAIVTLIGAFINRERWVLPLRGLTILWLLFIAWICLTTWFAMFPGDAAVGLERVLKVQLMTFATIVLITNRERLRALIWVIVVSLGYFGIKGGVFTLATAGAYRVWGPPGSLVEGNNEIALALLMVLPLMQFLRTTSEHRWVRILMIPAMILCGLSVLGSQSRGAFVGGVAMAAFLMLKSRRKVMMAVALAVTIPLLLHFMPDAWFERMRTIDTYESDRSATSRIDAWLVAVRVANDRPLGGGFEMWTPSTFERYVPGSLPLDAHSIYFKVLGEHGWVGLILFLAIGLVAWRTGSWIIRNTRSRPDLRWLSELARMTQVSLAAFAAGGAFLSLSYFDLFWHLVAMLVISRVLVEQALKHERLSPVTAGAPLTAPAFNASMPHPAGDGGMRHNAHR